MIPILVGLSWFFFTQPIWQHCIAVHFLPFQALLGIDPDLADVYESLLAEDDRLDRHHLRRGHAEYSHLEVLRPGFCRLNLPWHSSDAEVEFILDSLVLVSEHGWRLLPQYRYLELLKFVWFFFSSRVFTG